MDTVGGLRGTVGRGGWVGGWVGGGWVGLALTLQFKRAAFVCVAISKQPLVKAGNEQPTVGRGRSKWQFIYSLKEKDIPGVVYCGIRR